MDTPIKHRRRGVKNASPGPAEEVPAIRSDRSFRRLRADRAQLVPALLVVRAPTRSRGSADACQVPCPGQLILRPRGRVPGIRNTRRGVPGSTVACGRLPDPPASVRRRGFRGRGIRARRRVARGGGYGGGHPLPLRGAVDHQVRVIDGLTQADENLPRGAGRGWGLAWGPGQQRLGSSESGTRDGTARTPDFGAATLG